MSNLIFENTKITDIMSHLPVTMLVTSSAADIAKKMTEQKVGSILLVDHDNKPVGIATERDIVRRACSQNLPLKSVPAAILMSAPLVVVEASDNLQTAIESMANNGPRHLAVKNKKTDKQVVGILSAADIMRHIGKQLMLAESPIIAAAGLTIPKTSSRAITSAGGTADRAEVLMPVNLDIEEMKKVVSETKGCIVWGGSLDLAPADDVFVQIEYPLSIDPLLLPSIMAKKKAVGANYLALDIPAGRGTKVKTIGDADLLAKDFMELGKRLGIKTQCVISFGEQPVGHTIGPALEAQEALKVLSRQATVPDLIDKAIHLCGLLFSMAGKGSGERLAMNILKRGKAEKKMREIIESQGGDPNVKPGDIEVASQRLDIKSENSGTVLWMDNQLLIQIARAAGAPKDKKAGVVIHKKIGQRVKKGESIITVFSERTSKLGSAETILNEFAPLRVGDRREMIIHKVVEIPEPKKSFILER
jgi:AMP phosphorylase